MTARILIVDDVAANLRLLGAKLAAEYYHICTASTGTDALRVARDWRPDLILLDVMMPGMDGFECCRCLKSDSVTSHIPIIMVTALSEPAERTRGLDAGADDFLTKPVDYDTLMARVRSLVRLKRVLDEWRVRFDIANTLRMGSAGCFESPPIAGSSVLIVDDWDDSAREVAVVLETVGVHLRHARSAAEALKTSDESKFDLIIVNLSLTDDDPLRLVGLFRASDSAHDVPLLVIGEPSGNSRVLRSFDLGASDWLMQPLDASELVARVRNQIRRKIYQERLRSEIGRAVEMALVDPLTGLYNRRFLESHLESLRNGLSPTNVSLLMIDVDHFKSVNDQFGHLVGDQVLKMVASILREHTRIFDLIARYGGEEFVVVMPGATIDEARAVAERLRCLIAASSLAISNAISVGVTVSIGVSGSAGSFMAADQLLREADQFLYKAKSAGRNRVE